MASLLLCALPVARAQTPAQAPDRLRVLVENIQDPTTSPKSRDWLIRELQERLSIPGAYTERQVAYFRSLVQKTLVQANAAWEKKQAELSCPAVETEGSEDEVIRVDTELVMATMRGWTRTGAALSDLRPEELKLFVNGDPWEVEALDRGQLSFEVVLVLDFSGSMSAMRPAMAKAARDFAARLRPSDRMAVVAFGGDIVDVTGGFLQDPAVIEKKILAAREPDVASSAVHLAMGKALRESQVSQRASGRNSVRVIIMLTDGVDNVGGEAERELLDIAEESNALVYPVGFGARLENTFLSEVARRSGGSVFNVAGAEDLAAGYRKIQEDLANLYRVSFKPLPSCPQRPLPQQCQIKIRVLRADSVLRGRSTYPCSALKAKP